MTIDTSPEALAALRNAAGTLRVWTGEAFVSVPDVIAALEAERDSYKSIQQEFHNVDDLVRIKKLEAERDAALAAIKQHNDECQRLCGKGDQEAVRCGYRPYFEANGRRCSDCPTYWTIDAALAEVKP